MLVLDCCLEKCYNELTVRVSLDGDFTPASPPTSVTDAGSGLRADPLAVLLSVGGSPSHPMASLLPCRPH